MNKEKAKEYLPLIQALADGQIIQEDFLGQWCDTEAPTFYMEARFYRIKPEPRTFEMWLSGAGWMYPLAEGECFANPEAWERITVQEVLK